MTVLTLSCVVVLPINSFVEPLVSLSLGHSDKLVGLLSLGHSDKLVGLLSLGHSDKLVGLSLSRPFG
jgi:hypothetical protein